MSIQYEEEDHGLVLRSARAVARSRAYVQPSRSLRVRRRPVAATAATRQPRPRPGAVPPFRKPRESASYARREGPRPQAWWALRKTEDDEVEAMFEEIVQLAETSRGVCKTLVKYLFVSNISTKLLRDLLYRAFRVDPELQSLIAILEVAAMRSNRLESLLLLLILKKYVFSSICNLADEINM